MSFLKSIPGWFSGPALSFAQTEESAKGVGELPKITVETAFKEPVHDSPAALAGRTCPLSPRDILKVELEKIPSLSEDEVTVVSIPCIKLLVDDETVDIGELEKQVICDVSKFFRREQRIEIFNENLPSLAEKYAAESEITDEMEKQYLNEVHESLQNGLKRIGSPPLQARVQSLFLLSCFGSSLNKFIEKELKLEGSLKEISEKLSEVGTFTPVLRPCATTVDQLLISINETGIQFSGQLIRELSLVSHNPMKEYQIPYRITTNLQLKDERFEGEIEVEKILQQEEKEDFSIPATGGAGSDMSLTTKFYESLGYVKSSLGGWGTSLYASLSSSASSKKEPTTFDELIQSELHKIPLFNKGNNSPSEINLSEILRYVRFESTAEEATSERQAEAFAAYGKLKERNPRDYPYLSMETIERFKKEERVDLGECEIIINEEHINSLIDVLEDQVLALFNNDVNRRAILFEIGGEKFEPFVSDSKEDKTDYCLAVYASLKEQLKKQGIEEKDVRPKALSLIFSTCQVFDVTVDEKIDLISQLGPVFEIATAQSVTVSPSLANGNTQLKAQRDSIKLKVSPEEIALNYDCHRSIMYVKMNASKADYVPVHLLYQYKLDLNKDQYKGFIKTI